MLLTLAEDLAGLLDLFGVDFLADFGISKRLIVGKMIFENYNRRENYLYN